MKSFDSFFQSKLNKLESGSVESDFSSAESDFISEKKEKIAKRKPTGKKRGKSATELAKINKNYERNQLGSLSDSCQVQRDHGLDMQEKITKVRFNSADQINTQIPREAWEGSNSKTEYDFIEKTIEDKKLEARQKIDCKNKEKTGDVTSEPNKKDNNVDTDQREKSEDVKSESLEETCSVPPRSKIPQYAKKKKSKKISINNKKPSSFLPQPIRPIKL